MVRKDNKKNNKNTDKNGCHRFSGFDVHTTDYFIFLSLNDKILETKMPLFLIESRFVWTKESV